MDENREKQAMADGPEDSWDHPTPEQLSAYDAGELSKEESDAIQRHLAGCELCTEVLLDLHRFLDLPPEDLPREGVVDLETETEWRALRAKLDDQGLLPARRPRKPGRNFIAAVAAIFLVAIGLASYLFLQRTERQLTLDPDASVRSETPQAPIVQLPIDLLLRTSPNDSYLEYRVELKSGEQTVRTYPHLPRSQDAFTVKIPLRRWALKPGLYKFELQGVSDRNPGEPSTYTFQVR